MNESQKQGYPYWYNTTINAIPGGGGSQGGTIAIDASNDFELMQINLTAWLSSGVIITSRSSLVGTTATGTVTSGVGGTPTPNFESVELSSMVKLCRDGSATGAAVSMPGLHLIRLAFKVNDRDWQNEPLRADLYTGEPGRLWFFPRPMLIQANSSISVTAFNDFVFGANDGTATAGRGIKGNAAGTAAPTVSLQLSLFGHKLRRGA